MRPRSPRKAGSTGLFRPARLLVAVLLGVSVLAGCDSVEGTGSKGYVTDDGQLTTVAADERGEPVVLTGEDLDGEPVDLADLRGKPVVINLWWSDCPPCRVEAPILDDAADELGADAAFLGINIRDSSPENGKSFERAFGVDYPSVFSPDGKALLALRGEVPANGIPSTIVLDSQGRIAAKWIGKLTSARTLVDVVGEADAA